MHGQGFLFSNMVRSDLSVNTTVRILLSPKPFDYLEEIVACKLLQTKQVLQLSVHICFTTLQ